jgi:phosphate acetyltransferase
MGFVDDLGPRAARAGRRIVLAEGMDGRVRRAAERLRAAGHIDPILLLSERGAGETGPGAVRYSSDDGDLDRYAPLYRELQVRRELSDDEARKAAAQPLTFAALMLRAGDADGAVGGAVHSTAEVIRAALRCIGVAEGARYVTGAFYMVVSPFRGTAEPEVLTFADAGVLPDPDAEALAEIAAQAATMRRVVVGDEPRVAFLSFSTHGSAQGPAVEKVRRAVALFRESHADVAADGELQVDAALIEDVGRRKAPGSAVAGHANVLIFPDLGAGNIGYKLMERLGGATAIGPILHGLARPFNDLSRGSDVAAIECVAYVTALMAGAGS